MDEFGSEGRAFGRRLGDVAPATRP